MSPVPIDTPRWEARVEPTVCTHAHVVLIEGSQRDVARPLEQARHVLPKPYAIPAQVPNPIFANHEAPNLFFGGPFDPVGFGGAYNHTRIDREPINRPYNCKLGQPLKKWYAVDYGRCQAIFWT